jgi:hypothetical protein
VIEVRLGLQGSAGIPLRRDAEIRVATGDGESKKRYLGGFVNEVDAALAYDQAPRENHKDKAKLNFPDLPPHQR